MIAIRELHDLAEFEHVMALFEDIWHFEPAGRPITVELMLALAHAGNYVAGAFDGERLAGASVAFFGADATLHSHITGVSGAPGAGFALKLHQRRWALERGVERITWTFDPLVRRNAHFNLAKLGASPREYLPAFYGVMDDAINQGDESDRVLAVWPLTAPRVRALEEGRIEPARVPRDAVVALADEGGRPVPGRTDAATVLVAVPEDVERLRRADPGTAKAWRHAVRNTLGDMLAEGRKVTGFHDKSFYVVEKA
ncbi:GNAT family N-acetyltransferase [Nonomuraea sp. SBT364]|uniref:GNAT family N-acetyltransferase n=1 Tax=Nonomuraea sp. SBT364 TaxID=1580530 RepID=UPI000A574467|nr:GNAT family N-acetyltransferase [Nonomuraea sp. SBT364]